MNIGKDYGDVNGTVDPGYASRLASGMIFARRMVAAPSSYADARAALQFYFTRKAVELAKGSCVRAASSIGVQPETVRKFVAARGGVFGLTTEAQRQAELWASSLAIASTQYREALFIWSRCLLLAAIEHCKGNRLAASRRVQVHRNTMWRVPNSPEQTRMMIARRRPRATATAA